MKTCKSYERDGKEANDGTSSCEANLGKLLQEADAKAQRFAYGLAGNSEDAKELVQEASCRALKHWRSYDPVGSFQSWYLTIIRNVFYDSRRCRRQTIPLEVRDEEGGDGGLIDVLADGSEGMLDRLEREELSQALREALAALSAQSREVLRLCGFNGMRYHEAARELGVPVGTVRSRLHRARAALKGDAKLQGLGGGR